MLRLGSFSRILKINKVFRSWERCASTSSSGHDVCQIDVEPGTGIAIATMRKAPVNSLNLEFIKSLTSNISLLEKEENVGGLIITSGLPRIFSAGLDILEMYKPNTERATEFWSSFQNFWLKLYSTPLVTIAAINGNSPAGGCLIAVSCDYRVMASGNYKIGLNETQLGLVAPFWLVDTVKNTIGHFETERMVQLGHMLDPEEAQRLKLIDKVVSEDQLLLTAKKEMQNWLKIPKEARVLSKLMMRQDTMDRLLRQKQEDIENFINFVMNSDRQKSLETYLQGLKKRKN